MKFPTKIRITSKISYEILYVPEFQDKGKYVTYGECRRDQKQIVISLNQTPKEMIKSLIHETFHAMEYENKIEIPHKAVHKLEDAVLNVLKLNGWIK